MQGFKVVAGHHDEIAVLAVFLDEGDAGEYRDDHDFELWTRLLDQSDAHMANRQEFDCWLATQPHIKAGLDVESTLGQPDPGDSLAYIQQWFHEDRARVEPVDVFLSGEWKPTT